MKHIFYTWFTVAILFAASTSFNRHPFYISYTEITQHSSSKTLQLSVRIFTDDFEQAIIKAYQKPTDLAKPKNKKETQNLITDYIQKHVAVYTDNKLQNLSFVGYEIQEGSAWCYFETAAVPAFASLQLNNNILYDFNEQQINMVHVKLKGKDITEKLAFPKSSITFKL